MPSVRLFSGGFAGSGGGGGWEDGWNDDNGWMITAVLHAYQVTGNADFLTVAQQTWDCAYTRGWDTKYGGGGIWELMDDVAPTFSSTGSASKCALSNDPFIIWRTVARSSCNL